VTRPIGERDLLCGAIDLTGAVLAQRRELTDDFAWVALHHLAVAHRDAQGILALCDQALSDVSLLLVRRLWENTIRLEFIRQEPQPRSREFLEEAWVEEYRMLSKARRRAETASTVAQSLLSDPRAREKLETLEAQKELVSKSARQRAEALGSRPLWSLREMAQAVGVDEQYEFLYSFLSQRGHAGADLAKDYWREGPQGTLRTAFSDYSGMALGMACAWLLHLGMVFVEQYDPARAEGFSQLLSELAAGAD